MTDPENQYRASENEPNAKSISIIIPHYGPLDFLQECIGALGKSTLAPLEIIAVIDANLEIVPIVEKMGVRVVFNKLPVGDARARNQGAQLARGSILVFVDSDVLVQPNSLAIIQKCFLSNPNLGAAFGFFEPTTPALGFFPNYKNLLLHYTHITSSSDASTFSSACGAIRSDVFKAAGGFPERVGKQTLCDVEIGYLIREAGFSILLAKELQVTHLKPWTFRSLLKTDINLRAIPWARMILEKRNRFVNTLNLTLANRFSVIFIYLAFLFLMGTFFYPSLIVLSLTFVFAVFLLNLPLWRFFFRMRGFWFTIKAIIWHMFFFLYSGYGFLVALAQHYRDHIFKQPSTPQSTTSGR